MNKRVARRTLEAQKQTYEETNDGPIKRLCSTLINYEKTNGGPMKRP